MDCLLPEHLGKIICNIYTGQQIRNSLTFSGRKNHWIKNLPGLKKHPTHAGFIELEPSTPTVVVFTPTCRLVHPLNHSATEDWLLWDRKYYLKEI